MPGKVVRPQAFEGLSSELVKALSHPLRQKIMGEVTKRPMSPNQFRRMFGLSIHNVSYHFRQLEKAGCLEVIDEIQRRGAVEHIYAAKRRAFYDEESWARMPKEVRTSISTRILNSLLEAVSDAMLAGTFVSRKNHHITCNQADLDEEGWDEVQEVLTSALERIEEIREESEERVEEGAESMRASWGVISFESPPLPEMPEY